MNQQLKQRLTGFAVLSSLAIIFIPMLLDAPVEDLQEPAEIPAYSEMSMPVPVPSLPAEPVVPPEPTIASEPSIEQPNTVVKEMPVQIPDPAPNAGKKQEKTVPEVQARKPEARQDESAPAPLAKKQEQKKKATAPVAAEKKLPARKPEPQPAEKRAVARKKPDASLQDSSKHEAWTIQVKADPEKAVAEALMYRLRNRGFTAYMETVSKDKTTMYRVRVGPELDRARADRRRDELVRVFKFDNTWVTEYP